MSALVVLLVGNFVHEALNIKFAIVWNVACIFC